MDSAAFARADRWPHWASARSRFRSWRSWRFLAERLQRAAMSRRIDYFFTVLSPWAYIGHRLFVELARHYDVAIAYRPVALNEVFSETGGLPLAKRHPARQAYRMIELQRWREKRGLAFHLRPKHWPFDANPANRAVVAIVQSGGDPAAFLQAAFTAVWEREEDLDDPTVLARHLTEAGFDAEAIVSAAHTAATDEIYERNRLNAIDIGAFGSPCYVLDGEVFWGQDRLELLEDALKSGRPPFSATPAGP
jgi:2-hydroxychromene-2-carboxylate isomerase